MRKRGGRLAPLWVRSTEVMTFHNIQNLFNHGNKRHNGILAPLVVVFLLHHLQILPKIWGRRIKPSTPLCGIRVDSILDVMNVKTRDIMPTSLFEPDIKQSFISNQLSQCQEVRILTRF